MWLITGGAYQGKLQYALEITGIKENDIIEGSNCELNELLEAPLVHHFHLWIKRRMEEGQEVTEINKLVDQILHRNPNIVIIVDELGCGIVPMDAFDRNYRESVGRVCCKIAKEAKEVHRVICGLGMVIKHD